MPPFVDADPAVLGRVTDIAADGRQGVARDSWKHGAGQGGRHEPGLVSPAVDEAQVHAAHLLDPAMVTGVEPHDLVAALCGRLRLGQEASGVVAARFRLTGATRCGPAEVLGQPDAHRLYAAGETRAGRRRDEQEGDVTRRAACEGD